MRAEKWLKWVAIALIVDGNFASRTVHDSFAIIITRLTGHAASSFPFPAICTFRAGVHCNFVVRDEIIAKRKIPLIAWWLSISDEKWEYLSACFGDLREWIIIIVSTMAAYNDYGINFLDFSSDIRCAGNNESVPIVSER